MPANLFSQSLLQLSGILGVGIFALPYLFFHSNLYFALVGLLFLTYLTSKINNYYYDILEKSKTNHQLSGIASHFLGPVAGQLVALNLWLLALGALFAFIQMAGKFAALLLPAIAPTQCSLIFIFFLIFLYLRQGRVWQYLFSLLPLLFFIVPGLLYFSTLFSPNFTIPLLPPTLGFFGWTMFALSGFTIIPEVKSRQASLLGLMLAAFLYLIFVLCLVFLSGPHLSPDSVTGLTFTHLNLARALALFGLLTITKASLNFLNILTDIFQKDLHLHRKTSYSLVLLSPFFSLLFLHTNLSTLIQLIATISTFSSILIIFFIRLKLHLSSSQKIIIGLIVFLFLLAIIQNIQNL